MTQESASKIFNNIWNVAKQLEFKKVTTKQIEQLVDSNKCDSYEGDEKILYTKLYNAVVEYYCAIEKVN